MTGFCFLGPLFYHTNQSYVNLDTFTLPPSGQFPLGTDGNGFDVLGRLMKAGQASLEVGLAAAIVATMIGVVWGAVAGFFGGAVDAVMMRIVDVVLSIPTLLLLIVLSVLFNPSKYVLIFVIGSVAWLMPARLVRGETLTLRTREYVQAVRVMGGNGRRIVVSPHHPERDRDDHRERHVPGGGRDLVPGRARLPGSRHPLPRHRLGEHALRRGDLPDRRLLVADRSRRAGIVLVVVAINFIGDALRDALEVRLQRR